MTDAGDVTLLLRQAAAGDLSAEERIFNRLYGELRRRAARQLRDERPGHTLQPTALVHEVFVRLMRGRRQQWNDRAHFFAVASRAMRRVLVDHARRHVAAKRGGVSAREELTESMLVLTHSPERILAVDSALSQLAGINPRQARLVELRFFAGLTDEESAEVLGVSVRTVKRDWAAAKAWLYARLRA